jgi:hypothetical protein
MSTPIVSEIRRRPEAVAHDDFIDDLAVRHRESPEPSAPAAAAGSRA